MDEKVMNELKRIRMKIFMSNRVCWKELMHFENGEIIN